MLFSDKGYHGVSVDEIARRLGCYLNDSETPEIYAEMASVMRSLDNISWDRVSSEGAVTYPCKAPNQPGDEVVFGDGFPTPSGRGKLVPVGIVPPDELPDELHFDDKAVAKKAVSRAGVPVEDGATDRRGAGAPPPAPPSVGELYTFLTPRRPQSAA